jgi:dienelactone hydrolase
LLLRRLSVWVGLATFLSTAVFSAAQTPAAANGRKALDLLLAAKYPEFIQLLTPAAKEKLTTEFLRDHVASELKDFGGVQEIGQPISAKSGDTDLLSFPVKFTRAAINIQLSLDASGKVSGLYLRRPEDPLPTVWKRPAYSKPEAFHERQVTVGSDDWKLGGTLTVPVGKGPFPAVVLVHGPGPNDRDEAIFATKIFADIAEGLASRGIVVLRYDKRTRIYGPQMSPLPFTLKEETITDAVRALALVRTEPEADPKRVFVVSHSLGGYALPRIAKEDGKLAGAVVLAGNARRIEDISIAQAEAMMAAKGGATPDEQKRLDAMKQEAAEVRNLDPKKEHPDVLMGLPVEYFLDLKGYDAVAEAKRLGIPMLFLQGDRDFQVTMVDFGLWKSGLAGAKNISFHDYPTLNHLFISGDGPSSPVEYQRGGNVAPAVIDDVSAWIAGQKH